jgi:hypothetical protein
VSLCGMLCVCVDVASAPGLWAGQHCWFWELAEGAMAAGQRWAVSAPAIVPSHFATGRAIVEFYFVSVAVGRSLDGWT